MFQKGVNERRMWCFLLLFLFSTQTISADAEELPPASVPQQSDNHGKVVQSRASMANDQSAPQYTYMLGYQGMSYYRDQLDSGEIRPEGLKGFLQARFMIPVEKNRIIPVDTLTRFTTRYATAQDGSSGLGASDVFVLGMVSEWETGRFGFGPMFTLPASDEKYGSTSWTYGISGGVTQRFFNDRLSFMGVIGQTWGPADPWRPEEEDIEAPLVINPVAVYNITDSWYVSNGDMVIQYDWNEKAWLVPLGLRIGKLFVGEKSTWNAYLEYRTNLIYKDWAGSVARDIWRINLSYTIPAM
jgi:hypothetical protein